MAQRHTATSPEQRALPLNGRIRNLVRLAHVERIVDDKTGELAYAEIKDADGEVIQTRANRVTRRRTAWATRLRNDGHPWGYQPFHIGEVQEAASKLRFRP